MSDKLTFGESNIESLNSYCLFKIFSHIKKNCEYANADKDLFVKYLDLVNFANSCEIFTKSFKEWDPKLYEELIIEQEFRQISPMINVNLAMIYKKMQNQSIRERNLFWSAFLNGIKDNKELESVRVIYQPESYYSDHLDRFEDLLNVLKEKRTVRKLSITIKGYSFDNVEIEGLETLHLDGRIDVTDLIQLCQRNYNLQRLILPSADIYGRLSDIVPYCNHLEHLTISMKNGIDAAEYALLARLPQLKDLTLLGEPEEGTLLKLLQGLKESKIQQISILNVYITSEELYSLSEIFSLLSIKFCPRDCSSNFQLLQRHRNAIKTYRLMRPQKQEKEIDLESVKYRIRSSVSVKKFYSPKDVTEITTFSDKGIESDDKKIYNWYDLIHGSQLYMEAWITMDNIGLIPQICIKAPNVKVSKIELSKDMPITQKEIDILAAYSSIINIRCYLHQLPQMIAVKLQQLDRYIQTIHFFKRMDRIRTEHCEVRLINITEFATIILDFFEKDISINARIFKPLINLGHLKRLVIFNYSGNGSLVTLFKSFALMKEHTLEELEVAFLSPEEVVEVAKIRSLKELLCGFICSRFIEDLSALNLLEYLEIFVHPLGSLKALFRAIASKNYQTLRCLTILGTELTFEEVVELASIETLEGLHLGKPIKMDWEHQPSHRTGNHYVSYCERCHLPPSSSSNVQHRINTKALHFIPNETGLDTQIRFLTELYKTFHILNLTPLAGLPRLRCLTLYFGYTQPVMEDLLRTLALSSPKGLRQLTFDSQDFKLVSQFKKLNYLECFFYHNHDIDNVGLLMNLTELSLRNTKGIEMKKILIELRKVLNLEWLLILDKDLDKYEMAALCDIKALTRLTIGVASIECLKYIINLSKLSTLSISSTHYANENETDYINLICMKCRTLKEIILNRYYGYITKKKVGELLDTLKSVRDPRDHPCLLLRGIWVDFERLRQVDNYNEWYLQLESITANGYLSSDESEDSDCDF